MKTFSLNLTLSKDGHIISQIIKRRHILFKKLSFHWLKWYLTA